MWFPPLSYRTRIPRRNNFPGQRCSSYRVGSLKLGCIRSDTCQLRSLGRMPRRARILCSSCMSPVRRWRIVPARENRTRCDIHQDHILGNLCRCLLMLHHIHFDTTRPDTLEQPRTAGTMLCPKTMSCRCLGHTPCRSPPRCRRTRCGFRPEDRLSKSHKLQQPGLRTRLEPDQSGSLPWHMVMVTNI